MQNRNRTRLVALVMMFSCTVALLAGCVSIQLGGQSDKQAFLKQIKQITNTSSDAVFDSKPYAQVADLSAVFPLEVEIIGTDIYICGAHYDRVSLISGSALKWNDTSLVSVDLSVTKEEVYEVLTKLRDSGNYYLLETDQSTAAYTRIAVYFIEDRCYFVSIGEGDAVDRIHYNEMLIGG